MVKKKTSPVKKTAPAKKAAPVRKAAVAPAKKRTVATKKAVVAKSHKKAPAKKASNNSLITVLFVVVIAVALAALYMFTRPNSSYSNAGSFEGETVTDNTGCVEEGEDGSNIPECKELEALASITLQESVLGDNTGKMAWPIKKANWPNIAKPIVACNLIHPNEAGRPISTGIEIAVPAGTSVYAAYHGTVSFVLGSGKGGVVVVRTDLISSRDTGSRPIYFAYKFLSKINVKVGQKVAKTELIGLSGSGKSVGATLGQSVQFAVWTIGSNIGGKPQLDSAAGRKLLSYMLHPLNFVPNDRNIADCAKAGPYRLPGEAAPLPTEQPKPNPTPTPSGGIVFPMVTTKSKISNRSIFKNGSTSPYGHPYTAYDILVPTNTKVVAMYPGVVSKLSKDRCNTHIVGIYNSSKNIRYSYMHLKSNIQVKVGQKVEPGRLLGYTAPGPCGTPSHLHLDAIRGKDRLSCTRLSCSDSVKRLFVSLGPDLYSTYMKLPN